MTSKWRWMGWMIGLLAPAVLAAPQTAASGAVGAEDARAYVAFVEDFAGTCVARSGVQIQVKNTHPSRTIKVWFDRYYMGTGTGDRSRSELLPAAPPEPLGCSRIGEGLQEWRVNKAIFLN